VLALDPNGIVAATRLKDNRKRNRITVDLLITLTALIDIFQNRPYTTQLGTYHVSAIRILP
jgi:hypothetical protein